MLTLSDEELVARCKSELPDNTHSYEVLLQRHMSHVYNIIYRIVYDKEEAEDLSQEVFLKVYYGLKKFEQQASFSSWLYRIATNCALDTVDKKNRQSRTLSFTAKHKVQMSDNEERDQLLNQPSKLAGPEESAIQSELRDCINLVLCKLDREQAHLILLRDFDDRSYDEIASLLDIGLSAVKMRIHRARLAFQELFGHISERHMTFSISSGSNRKENV
jgi:RNA polymerase sigma-70 factor, ECF subfamily